MRCGTIDTGEFVEGFCQYLDQIDHWEKGRTRFGKVAHHINGDYFDDHPENKMTCHFGCHISFHKRTKLRRVKGKTVMCIRIDLYRRLDLIKRMGTKWIGRREPASKVVERLLDFYFANGGEELEAEYKRVESQK